MTLQLTPETLLVVQPSAIDGQDWAPQGRSTIERSALFRRYSHKLQQNQSLNRALVSFQANKEVPFHRWYKYREAFSAELVRYLLHRFRPSGTANPSVLDPFAGAGTTLITASQEGWRAVGIELLPIAAAVIRAGVVADRVSIKLFRYYARLVEHWPPPHAHPVDYCFPHIRITEKAFPPKTEEDIGVFQAFLDQIIEFDVQYLFSFAILSVLEDVSFTRKDGQYLRWDSRSGRDLRSEWSKRWIPDFPTAVNRKLTTMLEDLERRNGGRLAEKVQLIEGSCLTELPQLPDASFDLVVTSPPYCNRYDYTRTYALELAFMGYDDDAVASLRQALLSATVENKAKRSQLQEAYSTRGQTARHKGAVQAFNDVAALHEVLSLLRDARDKGELNNPNIPKMVENYFFEMNLVIRELARVVAPGGRVVMVNDNVRYHGEEVPIDLILSDFAAKAGLVVEHIWVLPRGKGNSSQQMGAYGRSELRKCVYVWSKPQ